MEDRAWRSGRYAVEWEDGRAAFVRASDCSHTPGTSSLFVEQLDDLLALDEIDGRGWPM